MENILAVRQADVTLTHGGSGGPLMNVAGAVVGIGGMILCPGIAIPSNLAGRFVAAHGRALRLTA